MHTPRLVKVFYCTKEVRSLMLELPLPGLLEQGSKILTADEFKHLRRCLTLGRTARIEGTDCWFEYETIEAEAA